MKKLKKAISEINKLLLDINSKKNIKDKIRRTKKINSLSLEILMRKIK